PVVTQNVLPLSRSERLRIPAVGSDAAQETEEPDGAVEVDGAVGVDDAVAVDGVVAVGVLAVDAAPAAAPVLADWAHPAVTTTPITAATA
nr:hypothetical protein [Actinomycetota bacterium]